jgi:two-component system nitrogen regulation sensor histidine kinase GlnL
MSPSAAPRRSLPRAIGERRGVVPVREEFDPSLPPVMANPDALVQVMLNLMTNAREACEGRDEGMGGRRS